MTDKIFLDENQHYRFDFSNSDNVYTLHDAFIGTILSDVDFIVEKDGQILFIEYKNANIADAVAPEILFQKIKTDNFYTKIARKFYDSLLYYRSCSDDKEIKKIRYVLLIEHREIDSVLRKLLTTKIIKKLPFILNEREEIKSSFIDEFFVLNLEEWSNRFREYTICLDNK